MLLRRIVTPTSEVLRAAEWTDGLRDLVTSVTIVLTGLVLHLIFKRKDWL